MDCGMVDEFEIREIFNELSSQNQMKLITQARQFHNIQKEKKNEKTVFNGDIGLRADIRGKRSICPDSDS